MSCERYVDALADHAAGANAGSELEGHLGSCARCRDELTVLRRALALADAEMGALLADEPSASLLARIRRETAEDGKPAWRPATLSWIWTAVAAALVLAVALIVGRGGFVAPRETRDAGRPSPARSARVNEPAPEPQPVRLPAPAATARPSTRAAPLSEVNAPITAARSTAPEAEVLVPPGEAAALLRFAASLEQRRVDPGSLLVVDLSAPLSEPKPLVIAPLEIAPLAIPPLDASDASGT